MEEQNREGNANIENADLYEFDKHIRMAGGRRILNHRRRSQIFMIHWG
jgi:hypothetical protein